MTGMVQAYFDKHVPKLDNWMEQDLQLGCKYIELENYLDEARAEWNRIPLEEKQIPYLAIEKPFWHAFHTLHMLFVSDAAQYIKEASFQGLGVVRDCYLKRGQLPEGHDAFRPLP
jgi:hypothetical protein